MRIYSKNVFFSLNDSEIVRDINVCLTSLDIKTILHGLEKSKISDPAEAEQAVSICSALKTLVHE